MEQNPTTTMFSAKSHSQESIYFPACEEEPEIIPEIAQFPENISSISMSPNRNSRETNDLGFVEQGMQKCTRPNSANTSYIFACERTLPSLVVKLSLSLHLFAMIFMILYIIYKNIKS